MSQRECGGGVKSALDRQEVRERKTEAGRMRGGADRVVCADRISPKERLWTMQKKDGCWDIEGQV